jgi:macrodomain Ter protein organizer (MatP/YcbG family)
MNIQMVDRSKAKRKVKDYNQMKLVNRSTALDFETDKRLNDIADRFGMTYSEVLRWGIDTLHTIAVSRGR